MKTYSPEELKRVPIQCGCGKDMEILAPMRARRDEMLLIIICPDCQKRAAIQMRIVDKVPEEIVDTFIEKIHSTEYQNAQEEDIPSEVERV